LPIQLLLRKEVFSLKKKIGIILALVMLFSVITALPAAAALTPISGTVLNDQLSFKIEGKAVVPVGDDGTPVLPISYNGTTYLPVRAMGYLLGLGIDWDGGTNTVLITSSATKTAPKATATAKTNKLIPISGAVLNSDLKFKLNGKAAVPVGDDGTPVLPISYNGTTYLPVRAMGYLLGLGIDWDGGTNTVLITSSATKTAPPATGGGPGWYLTRWEYIKDPGDTVDTGGKVGRFAGGDTYTDYLEGKGEKNDFTIVTARKLSNGTVAASGHVTTTWTDPPEYFGANDRPTVTVNRTADSTWGINAFSISFDMHDINPGGATMGKINFASPDGQTHVQAYKGTMQMQKAKTGKAGDKMAVIFHLNWYGFKYYYEWRD
jgi:uncharacterized Zn-binding protein involved in type VI secretion